MPLNLFNHREPHKITTQTSKPVKNANIATTIVASKKRLSTYDISKMVTFLNSKQIKLNVDEFVLAIDRDAGLIVDRNIDNFFKTHTDFTIILLELEKTHDLIQSPLNSEAVSMLMDLPTETIKNIDGELIGIITQIENALDYRINKDSQKLDFEFDYRVYPVIYNLITKRFNLSPENKIDISDKILWFVSGLQVAYLWSKIDGLKHDITANAFDISYQQIKTTNHINTKMEDIKRMFITQDICFTIND